MLRMNEKSFKKIVFENAEKHLICRSSLSLSLSLKKTHLRVQKRYFHHTLIVLFVTKESFLYCFFIL